MSRFQFYFIVALLWMVLAEIHCINPFPKNPTTRDIVDAVASTLYLIAAVGYFIAAFYPYDTSE